MNRDCSYRAQILAIRISGCAGRTEFKDLEFSPVDRRFLLDDSEQVMYDSPLAIPVVADTKLGDYLRTLADQICDEARALRRGRGERRPEMTDLEEVYAEIEGEEYRPPTPRQVDPMHVWLDLMQDMESLLHVAKMYPEISSEELYERWVHQFEIFFELMEASSERIG